MSLTRTSGSDSISLGEPDAVCVGPMIEGGVGCGVSWVDSCWNRRTCAYCRRGCAARSGFVRSGASRPSDRFHRTCDRSRVGELRAERRICRTHNEQQPPGRAARGRALHPDPDDERWIRRLRRSHLRRHGERLRLHVRDRSGEGRRDDRGHGRVEGSGLRVVVRLSRSRPVHDVVGRIHGRRARVPGRTRRRPRWSRRAATRAPGRTRSPRARARRRPRSRPIRPSGRATRSRRASALRAFPRASLAS